MNRKWIVLLVLLAAIVADRLPAQIRWTTPQIVHISGKVQFVGARSQAVLGAAFSPTDQLIFGDHASCLIAWDKATGLIVMKPKRAENGKKATGLTGGVETFAEVAVLQPHPPRLEHFSQVAQLKTHLEGRKYLILGESWLIADGFNVQDTILLLNFRNTSDNFQGGHKLEHRGDSILFSAKTLFEMNGSPIDGAKLSDFHLLWYHKASGKYAEITYFDLRIPDEGLVEKDIRTLLAAMRDKTKAEKADAVQKLVLIAYGEPDPHNYKRWMASHFPEGQ